MSHPSTIAKLWFLTEANGLCGSIRTSGKRITAPESRRLTLCRASAVKVPKVKMQQRWPERLWIVRHGESAGNVARDAAQAAGLARIAVEGRDVDVPLSPLGEVHQLL